MTTIAIVLYTLAVFVISVTNNWYKGLCLALVLLAVLERPDMPREVFGIPGLNPFNIMLLGVLVGFFINKGKEQLKWTVPSGTNRLWIIYGLICLVAFVRMAMAIDEVSQFHLARGASALGYGSLFKDHFLNIGKWIIPGLLVCYGANTTERRQWMLYSIAITSLLLAAQIISRMMPALIGSEDLGDRALRVLDRNIGYHRVDLAALMGSAAWAFFAVRIASRNAMLSQLLLGGFVMTSLAMALTGGRAGYAAWVLCGAFLCLLRWRKWLLLAPLAIVVLLAAVPGISDRVFQGFSEESHSNYAARGAGEINTVDSQGRDLYSITSGRVILWPVVIKNILESPWIGNGMHGFWRLRVNAQVVDQIGFEYNVGHSHNAFLEFMLDNGLIAFLVVLAFYASVSLKAMKVFVSKTVDPLYSAVAGVALSFVVVQLLACIGSQSLYPAQGTTLMWCAIGLFFSFGYGAQRQEMNAVPQSRFQAYARKDLV